MKNHFLLLPLLMLAAPVAAQHTKLAVRAGANAFKFGGESATSTSSILYNNFSGSPTGYTNSPYGSRLGAGVALGVRAQRVGARHGLLALDLGYEWVRSQTSITALFLTPDRFSSFLGTYKATGRTALRMQGATAFLGLGHRFGPSDSDVQVDVLVGPEVAYISGFRDKGDGTYDQGQAWAIDRQDRASNRFDARLRADATVWYHRLGLNASYSHGFLNYQSGLLGADREAYARTLRLGLAYRLK